MKEVIVNRGIESTLSWTTLFKLCPEAIKAPNMVTIDCWILVIPKDNADRMVVMPTVSMTLWNTVGLWWVILHRAWKIKPKLPSSTFHTDKVSLYLIICTKNILLIFAIWNQRWLLSLMNMAIFGGMHFLVELYVELTLRAVILSESTVECLKIYHKDWPISLLTNFCKIQRIQNNFWLR